MTLPRTRRNLSRALAAVEACFLVVLVGALLLVGLAQLVLRNVFHTGVLWFEPLSRYLVLWIAFAGAAAAAREDRHVRIDLVPRIVSGPLGRALACLTLCAGAAVCGVLTWWGIRFLSSEKEFGTAAFLSVPTWIALAALPLGFFTIGIRMLLVAGSKLRGHHRT